MVQNLLVCLECVLDASSSRLTSSTPRCNFKHCLEHLQSHSQTDMDLTAAIRDSLNVIISIGAALDNMATVLISSAVAIRSQPQFIRSPGCKPQQTYMSHLGISCDSRQ
eukprot:GHUV01044959.1.p1 GENE.GHUV01044959.1~~GHUV01044959.1.p1  ORF type:complete len:109 (+),score=19.31 GHUV01044959.1:282-608(+)